MLEGFEKSKSSSIHKTFSSYKEQKAAYRFFGNEKVTEEYLIDSLKRTCSNQTNDRSVLAFCDTSTITINKNLGRISNFDGLGIISRNQTKSVIGFFVHPVLIEDEQNGALYGVSALKVYNRSLERSTFDRSKRGSLRHVPIEEKESYKWVKPCIETRDKVLSQAGRITFVMDREGDIIEVFDRIPNERTDVVIRNNHNRKVINSVGKELRLKEEIANQKVVKKIKLKLVKNGNKRRKKTITATVKWGNIELKAPSGSKLDAPIKASYVEVKEVKRKRDKEPAIHWVILTSKQVSTTNEALGIVAIYKRRWSIEIFFKYLKSDGFEIEKTEMTTGRGIRKLIIMLMQASIRILQLKSARDGQTNLKTEDVFTAEEIRCLEKLNGELEGNTVKQQNPYTPDSLSWASWVIARLAGWTEFYTKSRPPGNKTFRYGLEKFDAIMIGFNLSE